MRIELACLCILYVDNIFLVFNAIMNIFEAIFGSICVEVPRISLEVCSELFCLTFISIPLISHINRQIRMFQGHVKAESGELPPWLMLEAIYC